MDSFSRLTLKNFRCYSDFSVVLKPGVNIIAGPNGSGKTTILEAVYLLASGTSFKDGDRDLIRQGAPWFRVEGLYGDQKRAAALTLNPNGVEKAFTIDGARRARLTAQNKLPVVLFEPDHLRLLRSSPAGRRDFIDALLSRLQPDYTWHKHQYERTLAQRNNLLKKSFGHNIADQMFVWDIKLAELGEFLVNHRVQLANQINQLLPDAYVRVSAQQNKVEFTYQPSVAAAGYKERILKELKDKLEDDIRRGFTSAGPHRDDFYVTLNGKPAASSASRGEVRSILLGLKLIELNLLSAVSDKKPLLLLDDVFSELDTTRRRALADATTNLQTIITTTDADSIKNFTSSYNLIKT